MIANEQSIFAFNLNTEITYRINDVNNIGFGLFAGNVFWNDKEKIRNEGTAISGFIFKYNYKNFTLSFINENSTREITSSRIGITYKILNK